MDRAPSSKKGQEKFLAAFLALAMGAAGYIVFLRPAQSELANKKQQVALATQSSDQATSTSIQADVETQRAAQTALPEKVDPKAVEKDIRTRAERSHVEITSFEPETPGQANLGQGMIFHIIAQGDYANLDTFLAGLDDGVYIDPANGQIRLDPNSPPGPMLLVPQLQLRPKQAHDRFYQATFTLQVPGRNG